MYSVKVRKKAVTIGGSDPSGGAGVQADLKTFSSLGIHGASVITCVTAQNTKGVQAIFPLSPSQVEAQMDSICTDMRPPVGKTGLLCNNKIARMVAKKVPEYSIRLVVDPVMTSTTGSELSMPNMVKTLRERLLPEAYLVTPNLFEASKLVGWKVTNLEEMKKAALQIKDFGVKHVLVTGGHLEGKSATDLLFSKKFKIFKMKKQPYDLHGTGCVLSSLITAYLAMGKQLKTSIKQAKSLITENIMHGYEIGSGISVVDTHAHLFNSAEKYRIVQEIMGAVSILETILFHTLVPQVGINIGYALPHPSDRDDICALEGRILRCGKRIITAGIPEFGSSRHIADVVLTSSSVDHRIRSAMNIAYDEKIVEASSVLTYKVASFDRDDEPEGVGTMEWGTMQAIEVHGAVPDLIYDLGGHGKEAMIRILGNNPKEVVNKLRRLIKEAYPKRKKRKRTKRYR